MNENKIIEEWRPICGYEGLYEVSNLGRVKSLGNDKTRKEKILSQVKMKKGYLMVNLYKNGKMKTCKVHRLVAKAFLENPNGYTCVNHIDENKVNNYVDNLEWCSYKYNSNHGTCQQRRVSNTDYKAIAEKLTNGVSSKQVYQYTKDYELVKIWESTQECGRNEFNQGEVAKCCRNEAKSHRGYIWSYHPL